MLCINREQFLVLHHWRVRRKNSNTSQVLTLRKGIFTNAGNSRTKFQCCETMAPLEGLVTYFYYKENYNSLEIISLPCFE